MNERTSTGTFQGQAVDPSKIIRNGLSPLDHPAIKERMAEADRTKRYLIAVWSVSEGKLNFNMMSNDFPSADLIAAEKHFAESINDFQIHTVGATDNAIAAAPKPTEESMAARDSGVVSTKRTKG